MLKIYRFTGIGEASAAMVMASLLSNPATAAFATGIQGKVIFFILKIIFMLLASLGLIVLNVTAAKLETIITADKFDGSFDSAERIIKSIRDTGREMTEKEVKDIDQPVIDAFRKFASFGRKK